MNTSRSCPFCTLPESRLVKTGKHGIVVRDAYPVSPGHALVIPRRHTGSFFDLTPEERTDLLDLLDEAKRAIDAKFAPQAHNIGINDGPARRADGAPPSHPPDPALRRRPTRPTRRGALALSRQGRLQEPAVTPQVGG